MNRLTVTYMCHYTMNCVVGYDLYNGHMAPPFLPDPAIHL